MNDRSNARCIFVFIGTTLWAIFITAMGNVANGLIGNTDLVMRTNIPKIGFAVTGLAPLCYSIIVGFVVLAIVMMLVHLLPSLWAILYPIAMLPIIVLGVGMGLILSVVGSVARDVTALHLELYRLPETSSMPGISHHLGWSSHSQHLRYAAS